MTQDPPRLMDSASGGSTALQRLLRAGSSELPNEQQLRALESRLGPILDPPPDGGSGGGGEPAGGSGTAAASGLSAGAKLAIGVGLLAAGVGALAVPNLVSSPEVPPAPAVVAVASTVSRPSATVITTQTRNAVASSDRIPQPPSIETTRTAPSSSPPTASASARPASPDPVAEARLLQRAQDALAGNPAEAMSLCAEHAKRFPGGVLSQEREVITIQALAALGRRSEAKARAEQFRRAHPRSAHLRRIESLLEPMNVAEAGH